MRILDFQTFCTLIFDLAIISISQQFFFSALVQFEDEEESLKMTQTSERK